MQEFLTSIAFRVVLNIEIFRKQIQFPENLPCSKTFRAPVSRYIRNFIRRLSYPKLDIYLPQLLGSYKRLDHRNFKKADFSHRFKICPVPKLVAVSVSRSIRIFFERLLILLHIEFLSTLPGLHLIFLMLSGSLSRTFHFSTSIGREGCKLHFGVGVDVYNKWLTCASSI